MLVSVLSTTSVANRVTFCFLQRTDNIQCLTSV